MNGTAQINRYFVLRCQNMANYFQMVTKNGHFWYFTYFIEQLNLSFFILNWENCWECCGLPCVEWKLQSSVHLIPMDPLPVLSTNPRPGVQTSSPYSTQMCLPVANWHVKILPHSLNFSFCSPKKEKKGSVISFLKKVSPFLKLSNKPYLEISF